MTEYTVQEHKISMDESGLNEHGVKMKQQVAIFKRRTVCAGVRSQSHEEVMLQAL